LGKIEIFCHEGSLENRDLEALSGKV
jgi:hypothetical protein